MTIGLRIKRRQRGPDMAVKSGVAGTVDRSRVDASLERLGCEIE